MQTNAKNFSGDGVSDIIVQIEQLLIKNFINKSQLAAYLGINPATVSRWMSGKCRPRNEHLIRLKAHPVCIHRPLPCLIRNAAGNEHEYQLKQFMKRFNAILKEVNDRAHLAMRTVSKQYRKQSEFIEILSSESDISYPRVMEMYGGGCYVSLPVMVVMCRIFGISPVWLLLGVGDTFVQPEDLELANALKRALELEKERVSELERELESEKSRSEEYKTRFEESLEVIQKIMGS